MKKNEGMISELVSISDILVGVCDKFQASITKDDNYSNYEIIFFTANDDYTVYYSNEKFSVIKKEGKKRNYIFEEKLKEIVFVLNLRLKKTKGIQAEIKNYIETNFFLELPVKNIFKSCDLLDGIYI